MLTILCSYFEVLKSKLSFGNVCDIIGSGTGFGILGGMEVSEVLNGVHTKLLYIFYKFVKISKFLTTSYSCVPIKHAYPIKHGVF